jgi:hypothetical protein
MLKGTTSPHQTLQHPVGLNAFGWMLDYTMEKNDDQTPNQ